MTDYPVDIVIPWVDGSDPAWIREHDRYTANSLQDNSSARYREWDLFRFWFRSVEENAAWVNRVHLLTWGHLPPWLNRSHPKLHVVRHEDFIPEKYLPTFSSHTIELNMHRVPGLADRFVYFNDDVYLSRPTEKEDFFRNGLPADTAVWGVIKNDDVSNFMPYIMLNMTAVINMHFPKRAVLKKDFAKWLSPRNGRGVLNNLYLLPWGTHTGFRNYHGAVPFLKETFETVWREEGELLDRTCSHKFRGREDVNQYLMRYWQLCEGKFVPHRPESAYLTIKQNSAAEAEALLNNKKYKVVCLNDDPMGFDFEEEQRALHRVMEARFPRKSQFEK